MLPNSPLCSIPSTTLIGGGGEEYKMRRTLIENNLVDAIVVLPQDMFYTTNISVTIWMSIAIYFGHRTSKIAFAVVIKMASFWGEKIYQHNSLGFCS
jgi:hypothetical protein